MIGEAVCWAGRVARPHSLNLSKSRPDFVPQKATALLCSLPAGTVTVKLSACSIRVKVWRESRTATMNTARCQMQPMVAQPMVMVFTASPALTVRKAPCLMRAIRASALSR